MQGDPIDPFLRPEEAEEAAFLGRRKTMPDRDVPGLRPAAPQEKSERDADVLAVRHHAVVAVPAREGQEGLRHGETRDRRDQSRGA